MEREGFDLASVAAYNVGSKDREVIEMAKKEARILLTFDKDFGELVFKQRMQVKGVVLLRFSPKSPDFILKRLRDLLSGKEIEFKNNFLVVEEDRVRVRKIR